MTEGNPGSDETVAVAVIIILLCGAVAAIVAITMGIVAFTHPYPGWVFFVPVLNLFLVGYGTAYVLDHDPKRRLATAVAAAVIGSAVFLVALYTVAADAPILHNAGALLTVLGGFGLFAIVPTMGVCFGIALSCHDVRAALFGHTLVDVTALPDEMIAPVRPYLHDFLQHPPWRRWSFPGVFYDGPEWGELYRISEADLQGLFAKASELLANREQIARQEIAVIEAQNARDGARAREAFLASLSTDDRGLLEAQLRAKAAAAERATQLKRENTKLTRSIAQLTQERDELDQKFRSWVHFIRKNADTVQGVAAVHVVLAAGERYIAALDQAHSKNSKEVHHATG